MTLLGTPGHTTSNKKLFRNKKLFQKSLQKKHFISVIHPPWLLLRCEACIFCGAGRVIGVAPRDVAVPRRGGPLMGPKWAARRTRHRREWRAALLPSETEKRSHRAFTIFKNHKNALPQSIYTRKYHTASVTSHLGPSAGRRESATLCPDYGGDAFTSRGCNAFELSSLST